MTSCSCQRGGSRSRSRRLWKALGCDAADYLTDGRARDDFHPLFFFFSPHSMDHQYHQQNPNPASPVPLPPIPPRHPVTSPATPPTAPTTTTATPATTSSTTATVHASPASQPNDATSIPMAPEPQQTDDTTPSLPSAATTTNSRELSDFDPRSSSSPPADNVSLFAIAILPLLHNCLAPASNPPPLVRVSWALGLTWRVSFSYSKPLENSRPKPWGDKTVACGRRFCASSGGAWNRLSTVFVGSPGAGEPSRGVDKNGEVEKEVSFWSRSGWPREVAMSLAGSVRILVWAVAVVLIAGVLSVAVAVGLLAWEVKGAVGRWDGDLAGLAALMNAIRGSSGGKSPQVANNFFFSCYLHVSFVVLC